jgi:hypothetical protein
MRLYFGSIVRSFLNEEAEKNKILNSQLAAQLKYSRFSEFAESEVMLDNFLKYVIRRGDTKMITIDNSLKCYSPSRIVNCYKSINVWISKRTTWDNDTAVNQVDRIQREYFVDYAVDRVYVPYELLQELDCGKQMGSPQNTFDKIKKFIERILDECWSSDFIQKIESKRIQTNPRTELIELRTMLQLGRSEGLSRGDYRLLKKLFGDDEEEIDFGEFETINSIRGHRIDDSE